MSDVKIFSRTGVFNLSYQKSVTTEIVKRGLIKKVFTLNILIDGMSTYEINYSKYENAISAQEEIIISLKENKEIIDLTEMGYLIKLNM
jgi:hypothetical protein